MQDIIDLLKEIWDLHKIKLQQQRRAVDIIESQSKAIDALTRRIKELEERRR